jgi:hypothetical protein
MDRERDQPRPGILAIWNDCRAGREADFERWFQTEHLAERLSVPGFLFGRRHQALSGSSAFFNFYLTQSPDVLTSSAYRARLDDPTPLTRMIMTEAFINMSRTVCERVVSRGAFRGAYAVTARFSETLDVAALDGRIAKLCERADVTRGEIWLSAEPANLGPSEEERLRGGDRKISGCLIVDTLRQDAAENVAADLAREYPRAEIGVFRVLCSLGRGDL